MRDDLGEYWNRLKAQEAELNRKAKRADLRRIAAFAVAALGLWFIIG